MYCAEHDKHVRAAYVSCAGSDKRGPKLFARDNTIRELKNEKILLIERIDDLANNIRRDNALTAKMVIW